MKNNFLALDAPLIEKNPTFKSLSNDVSDIVERKTQPMWYLWLGLAASLAALMFGMIGWLFWEGTRIWGLNVPVGWGWAIVNFFLGRHWACRDAHLGNSFSIAAKVENIHKSVR